MTNNIINTEYKEIPTLILNDPIYFEGILHHYIDLMHSDLDDNKRNYLYNDKRKKLFNLIKEKYFKILPENKTFILTSGKESNIYFDLKSLMMTTEGITLSSSIMLDYIIQNKFECIGGMATGAIPLVSSILQKSYLIGYNLIGFYTLKEPKKFGLKNQIIGYNTDHNNLLIDDVGTYGKTFKQIKDIIFNRGQFNNALVIIDREEGAKEELEKYGIELNSIFKASEFF